MAVKTRFPLSAGLCWLAVVLAVVAAPRQSKSAEPEKAAVATEDETPEAGPAERLSSEQRRIAEKFRHLEKVLLRMAELSEATDPRRAALLKKTIKQSGDKLINVQFEQLVEMLGKDRLGEASDRQQDLGKDLGALLELLLSENRAKRIEAEKTRIRNYLKRINRLIKQQKDVQGRTQSGDKAEDLSDEQGQLAENAGELADDIKENEEGKGKGEAGEQGEGKGGGNGEGKDKDEDKDKDGGKDEEKGEGENKGEGKDKDEGKDEGENKDEVKGEGKAEAKDKDKGEGKEKGEGKKPGKGQTKGKGEGKDQGQSQEKKQEQQQQQSQPQDPNENPARKRLEAAQQRMKQAEEKLKDAQREGAVEQQEQAIRELELAKAELEEILRQLREEEIMRMLAMLEARFRNMLKLQREVHEGTVSLDEVPESQRSGNHEIDARRLSVKETQIVIACDKALLVLREDGTAVAFPEAVRQMREDMQQVVYRLARTKIGKITQVIEEDIIAALEEMIEALKKAQDDQDEKQKEKKPGQPPPPGEPKEPPLIDVLAEIKMIRALQMRVNRRTDRYAELIDGGQADDRELIEALQRLAQRELRIYQVTRDLQKENDK